MAEKPEVLSEAYVQDLMKRYQLWKPTILIFIIFPMIGVILRHYCLADDVQTIILIVSLTVLVLLSALLNIRRETLQENRQMYVTLQQLLEQRGQ